MLFKTNHDFVDEHKDNKRKVMSTSNIKEN